MNNYLKKKIQFISLHNMEYTLQEAKETAQRFSKFLDGELFIVIYKYRVGYIALTQDIAKGKRKKVYHAERFNQVHDSDASLLRQLQRSSNEKRRKVSKKYNISIESDSSFLGTDDYFRWLSEVDRYYQGE